MIPDLLLRKRTRFVLWRPGLIEPAPALLIGPVPLQPSSDLAAFREIPLRSDPEFPELWQVDAVACELTDGRAYLYWFKVRDTSPQAAEPQVLYCTDPLAFTVDRRFQAPQPAGGAASGDPASVILFLAGELVPCDPAAEPPAWTDDPAVSTLPTNNQLVIYELPTRWVRPGEAGAREVGVGTFRDVLALLETEREAPAFAEIPDLGQGSALLRELGCNALELLPPADSDDDLGWGYGTANFLAADFQLGGGSPSTAPAASSELRRLVACCHRHGVRFFDDMVMAFARNCPYRRIAFADFFVTWKAWEDPTRDPEQGAREGFGGDLFRYQHWVEGYHPISGRRERFVPAREYLKVHLAHWLEYYRVDGLRLDSVNNTGSDDFLGEFRALARELWRTAERGQGLLAADLDPRFLVVGEELSVPVGLVAEGRLDGLWNERFKQILRQLLLGRAAEGLSLEDSVRRMLDCRELGFSDGAQVVNYVTSHDVGGAGNERLYDYLMRAGVVETEARIELAFACLLTAVGIPMILAGEEFADQHDLDVLADSGGKQVDPVNYARRSEPWRRRVFDYVARLVRLRTGSPALGQNDLTVLHVDLDQGKRVFAWQRGSGDARVVVVANFSDWGTADPLDSGAEYVVPGFPATPEGCHWREITQERDVPPDWIGREPLFPWEAKVYSLQPLPTSH